MSTPSPSAEISEPKAQRPYCPVEKLKPYLIPYYLTIAAVLGALTAGFVVVIVLLILVVANFNVLALIESFLSARKCGKLPPMPAAIPPSIVAEAVLIMAWQLFVFFAPLLAVAALWWFVNRTDRIIGCLFPHLEWEKSLGWLNIRAERRANAALRWFGYGIQASLAVALYGIVWVAEGLQNVNDWPDLLNVNDLSLRIAVLILCIGMWVIFLGSWLIPKLRAEREEAELKRFRAEMEGQEKERERQPRSRIHSLLRKPRINAPEETLVVDRARRRRGPGG